MAACSTTKRGRIALLAATMVASWLSSSPAYASIFSNMSFATAKEKADAQHKFLIIDFTASWCGPCKKMDITTWSDPHVQNWVSENAIAIQVDFDEERRLAMSFGVSAMPTVIVFSPKDFSKEFDREIGYQDAIDTLDWFKAIKAGKLSKPTLEDKIATVTGMGGPVEVQTRYKYARFLLVGGRFAEATNQFVWLWTNIPKQDPDMESVRSSYITADMKTLLRHYPNAKPAFAKLRDSAEAEHHRGDWINLNTLLDEDDKSLAWFDNVKKQPGQVKSFAHIDHLLQALLIRNNRWSDMGKYLYKDPMKKISNLEDFAIKIKDFQRRHNLSRQGGLVIAEYDPFPETASVVFAAMLAAGRDREAEAVLKESIRFDDSKTLRQAFAKQAEKAGQTRPEPQKWLGVPENPAPEQTGGHAP